MNSVFSKIINGELPGHFVWKDDLAVAIMTIAPIREGHVLVIPRAEIDHWDELEPSTAAHLMTLSQRIAIAQKQQFPCKRIAMIIAGFEVPHTHLHLIPCDHEGELHFSLARPAEQEVLAENAARLRGALADKG